jgi:RNA polymerase sigma factor (sigma-70 family)
LTELELIQGCVREDRHCQKYLFDKFAGRFMTICLRYGRSKGEAEDMLQEGFINIFNNIQRFRNEGAFEGWLTKVIVNSCLYVLRSKKVNLVSNEEGFEVASSEPYSYETISETELLKLINTLPTGYKVVFNLYVIEGYSHEEIAALLNIKESTSRSQLVKARRILQKQIIELQKIAV